MQQKKYTIEITCILYSATRVCDAATSASACNFKNAVCSLDDNGTPKCGCKSGYIISASSGGTRYICGKD